MSSGPVYLSPLNNGQFNCHLITNSQVLLTKEADDAFKVMKNYGISSRTLGCLTVVVAIVALGIILGTSVDPAAAAVTLLVVVPIGVALSFRARHREISDLFSKELNIAIGLQERVADSLTEIRTAKLNHIFKAVNSIDNHRFRTEEQARLALEQAAVNYPNEKLYQKGVADALAIHSCLERSPEFASAKLKSACLELHEQGEREVIWVTSKASQGGYDPIISITKERFSRKRHNNVQSMFWLPRDTRTPIVLFN